MRSRWGLAALPFVGAVTTYLVLAALHGGADAERAYVLENYLALGVAAAGAGVAALAFGPGDYLRRAWGLMALCYALLLGGTALFGATTNTAASAVPAWVGLTSGILTFAANAAMVAGTLLVARAWRVAGLDILVSRRTRWLATAASVLLALVLAGGAAWDALRSVLGGNLGELEDLASSLGDGACLALLGPIVLTALALRGGALAWPWALLALCSVGWLLFDSVLRVGAVFSFPDGALRPVEEAFRMFACLAAGAAGLLQRQVLAERVPESLPSPSVA